MTNSLRSLGTDYIDVLAMHDPAAGDAENDEIFVVLRRLIDKGYVRAVSIAGAPDSIIAAIRSAKPVDIAQFPDTPLANAAPLLRSRLPTPPMFVTHGVFDSDAAEAIARRDGAARDRIVAIAGHHGIDASKAPSDLLLPFAFSNNPEGVVIVSMFNPAHIERNIAAATALPKPGFAAALRDALAPALAETP